MKKIIGVLGVTAVIMAMFFNAKIDNSNNSNMDWNLLQVASAETNCAEDPGDSCAIYGLTIKDCDESGWGADDCQAGDGS